MSRAISAAAAGDGVRAAPAGGGGARPVRRHATGPFFDTRPGQFRANGTLRNQPGFYDAFGVKPGDGMHLPPEKRARIW